MNRRDPRSTSRLLAQAILVAGLSSCTPPVDEISALPEPSIDSSLIVGDYLFVSRDQEARVLGPCDHRMMPVLEVATPLARRIASGQEFSLANDTEALALLDSMLHGSDADVRRFYFWIVTKSLARSDGYYSEGVGYWGTQHLFHNPAEFLTAWSECISEGERKKWAWYLAAEEHIGSENQPTDEVLAEYRQRLESATSMFPEAVAIGRERLLVMVDSIYRSSWGTKSTQRQ